MSAPTIVVIGDVMVDVIARVNGPPIVGSDTPASVSMRHGGSAANTAAWLGHLGAPVVFVGCVGDDAQGREAASALRGVGVVPRMAVSDVAATGMCVVLVGPDGERTMLPDAGANARLSPEHLPLDTFVDGGHLHVSGYAVMRPSTRLAALSALAIAWSRGMGTSLDPASAAPLAEMGAAAFRAAVAGVDMLMVTLDEAEVLTGSRDVEAIALDLLGAHREIVLKRGSAGATWFGPAGARVDVPAAPPVGAVVDTTGAGDAFCAAWLAARRSGAEPAEALTGACGLAARVVARAGARPMT